jgi:hypothetical protein
LPKGFPENSEGRIQHVKRSAIFEFDVAAGTYRAGVTLDGQLRGEHLTKYLLFTAADNYQVVYALPEVDSEFMNDMAVARDFG